MLAKAGRAVKVADPGAAREGRAASGRLVRSRMPADVSQPLPLRLAAGLALIVLLASFVGGATYLAVVLGRAPIAVGALDEARRLAARGALAGAAREYEMHARLRPFDANGLVELGVLLFRDGRVADAGAAFEAALVQRPGDGAVLARLGRVRTAQGRYAEAAALYRRALERSPRDAGLLNDLGRAYALGGQLDAAIAQFRAALTIEPLPESQANLERALADRSRSGPP
jgi:tetratricopeptide (TPR) repeat protein